jgi:hypothetical protein
MGWDLSCETGFSEVPIHFADEKATLSHAKNGEYLLRGHDSMPIDTQAVVRGEKGE